jgi:hypothetical protein
MSLGKVLEGAVQGGMLVAVAFLLSRFTRDVVGRALLAVVLAAAAAIYVGFAAGTGQPTAWLVTEILGVALFGAMAVLGLRGSAWWLAAGWALHPVWDLALHYAGPGRSFAPDWYTVSCLGFDLIVAAYIAAVYGSRLGGGRATRRLHRRADVAGRELVR